MTERRQRRRIRDRARIQSSLSIVPSLFTVGNIFCGYYSAISTLRGNYDNAAIAIGVGIVLDALDGRIARLTKTSSDFGVQLDSIADVLTFGIAPAILAFSWGLNSIAGIDSVGLRRLPLLSVAPCGWPVSIFKPRNRRMRVRSDILWVCPFRWVPQ